MRIRPLHPDFGAEVLDFDVHRGGTSAEIEELRSAYDEFQLLLFRGAGRISPERHVEFTSWFGPPAPVANNAAGALWSVLKNDEAAGSYQLPFHSDLTYTDVPIKAICLHALDLPAAGTSTTFVSGIAAWSKLSSALQEELAPLTAQHIHISNMPEYNWPPFIAEHPVRLIHPRTGRPVLFVTEHHVERIVEVAADRSDALLRQLFAHLYADERRYEHWWQSDDLLMWDNLAVQHARTRQSDPSEGKRALQRVALSEATLDELVERARQRQAA